MHHTLLTHAVAALLGLLGFHDDDIHARDMAQEAAVIVDEVHFVALIPEAREWVDARRRE